MVANLIHLDELSGSSKYFRRRILQKFHNHPLGECAYCGAPPIFISGRRGQILNHLTLDHILPVYRGGLTVESNLAPCCFRCNQSKRDRLLWEWWPQLPWYTLALHERFIAHYPHVGRAAL